MIHVTWLFDDRHFYFVWMGDRPYQLVHTRLQTRITQLLKHHNLDALAMPRYTERFPRPGVETAIDYPDDDGGENGFFALAHKKHIDAANEAEAELGLVEILRDVFKVFETLPFVEYHKLFYHMIETR